ncbi:DUF6192 family protein [Streptomyces sp. NPDC053560]|uniref:DUF6192 family protein n=1 Tax=Streptomyces sp. NPDC053560 TaxID=3365711 RepID=UPI0037D5D763
MPLTMAGACGLFYRAHLQAEEWLDDAGGDVPGNALGNFPVALASRCTIKVLLFLGWKKVCHQLLTVAYDRVPALRDEQLAEDVQEVIAQDVARFRAACDWAEHTAVTGEAGVDEELACLLHVNRGSGASEDGDGEGGAGTAG